MNISQFIDHTILKPFVDHSAIEQLCREADQHGFYSVCVSPYYAELASGLLENSRVKVSTVVGFPYGYNSISSKVESIKRSIELGADEIDAVVNLSALANHDWKYLTSELDSLVTSSHLRDRVIKLIVEAALLSDAELQKICELCVLAGADFVKTSTGVNAAGANAEMVARIRELVGEKAKIKASGGIATRKLAEELIAAGAERLGCSRSIDIVGV